MGQVASSRAEVQPDNRAFEATVHPTTGVVGDAQFYPN